MEDSEKIRELYDRYQDAMRNRDFKAAASFYTTDGVLMPPDKAPLEGRSAIRQHYENSGTSGPEMVTELKQITTDGDFGWVTGTVYWEDAGERRHIAFMDVWKRKDDQWKIAACIGNSSNGFTMG